VRTKKKKANRGSSSLFSFSLYTHAPTKHLSYLSAFYFSVRVSFSVGLFYFYTISSLIEEWFA